MKVKGEKEVKRARKTEAEKIGSENRSKTVKNNEEEKNHNLKG